MTTKNQSTSISKTVPVNDKVSNIPFWVSIFFLIFVTYFVFSGAVYNEFVNWDDQVYVEEQPLVLNKEYTQLWKTPVSLNYHPVTMMSLAMQVPKNVKKLSPAPFIHLNIWLHIFNSVFVFLLIWLINDKKWLVALLTAAIFALHPMHVESVVWVSERKDVLYTFFFLLAAITYWQNLVKNKNYWLILTFCLFLLSVLSKAMAVTLPVVLLLLDYWKGRNLKDLRLWLEKIPFFAVSLFFGLMAVSVQSGGDFGGSLTLMGEKTKAVADAEVFSLLQRFQFAAYGFVQYIFKFFVPTEICAFYPYPDGNKMSTMQGLMYPLTFILISAAAIWSATKTKIFAFGTGFYLVTVALVLQFMSVGLAIMADRYTYVPYIGLAFIVVYAADKWLMARSSTFQYVAVSILSLFIILLSVKTKSQVDVWQNSETLWSQAIQYYPKEDLALANRGNYRGKTGNIPGAMEDFENAIADGCERADVYEGLGNSYGTLSMQNAAKKSEYAAKSIEMYQQALKIDPTKGNIHYNLGITQLQTDPSASIKSFEAALKYMPDKVGEILPTYGMALLNSGQYSDAIAIITQAMTKSAPTDAMYYHRGLAQLGTNNTVAAKNDFLEALKINPNNQEVKDRLSGM